MSTSAARGNLKGLDGRRIPIRSEHAALNSLLQSAGAILCKQWIVLVDASLQSQGLTHDPKGDYSYLAFVHDELQIAVRPGTEKLIGEVCIEMAAEAGRRFDLRCPLTAEYKTGKSWAETH